MNIIIKPFNKPTHWSDNKAWINLRVDFVEAAKKAKQYIVIKLPEGYCEPMNPTTLLKYGTKTQAVFLYPNHPMELVGAYYTLFPPKTQEWIKNDPYFWDYL